LPRSPPVLPSFPTRRSSDLHRGRPAGLVPFAAGRTPGEARCRHQPRTGGRTAGGLARAGRVTRAGGGSLVADLPKREQGAVGSRLVHGACERWALEQAPPVGPQVPVL